MRSCDALIYSEVSVLPVSHVFHCLTFHLHVYLGTDELIVNQVLVKGQVRRKPKSVGLGGA